MDSDIQRGVAELLQQLNTIADRYGYDRLLVAAIVGALVQVISVLVFRLVGAVLSRISGIVSWAIGAAIAFYLLDPGAIVPVDSDQIVRWVDLVLETRR